MAFLFIRRRAILLLNNNNNNNKLQCATSIHFSSPARVISISTTTTTTTSSSSSSSSSPTSSSSSPSTSEELRHYPEDRPIKLHSSPFFNEEENTEPQQKFRNIIRKLVKEQVFMKEDFIVPQNFKQPYTVPYQLIENLSVDKNAGDPRWRKEHHISISRNSHANLLVVFSILASIIGGFGFPAYVFIKDETRNQFDNQSQPFSSDPVPK